MSKPGLGDASSENGVGIAVWDGTVSDARQATNVEHELTFIEAVRIYWKAVIWSLIISFSIIMEGFDSELITGFFSLPAFQEKYGEYYGSIGYQIAPRWQTALGMSSPIGMSIGLIANGFLVERFGYKKVLFVSYLTVCGFIFITFFAPSVEVLFVGEVLCCIPFGIFGGLAPSYAADVCPLALRNYLTMYSNICWILGHTVFYSIMVRFVNDSSQWAYKIPFAVQWVWPIPLLCITYFAPESPYWLVRHGRFEDAEKSIERLSSKSSKINAKATVAMLIHTDGLEKEMETGSSYLDLFRGVDMRRTEIATVSMVIIALVLALIGGNSSYFFEQAGLSASNSFKLTLGSQGLSLLASISAWLINKRVGNRIMYIFGLSTMTVLMFIIGFLTLASNNKAVPWVQAVLEILWAFIFNLTVGPVSFSILSETSSTRLRSKTVGFGRASFYVMSVITAVISPYLMNPTSANLQGRAGFVCGAISFLCVLWAFFRLPNTSGRTFEELDLMFSKKVSARKFKEYEVDAYANEKLELVE